MDKKAWEDKAWETVRRALGKLVSHVTVHDCGPSAREISVRVLCSEAMSPPVVPPGRAEWQPFATVRLAAVPTAGTGLRESSLLPAAHAAAEDCAVLPPHIRPMPIVHAESGRIESAGLAWHVGITRLPDDFLCLPVSAMRIKSVLLPARPETARLTGWGMNPPAGKSLRLPRVDSPRVRWGGDAVVSRMPLIRHAQGAATGLECLARQGRLAEAAHLPPGDVELLGVYPGVPILAVSRIVVEEEGLRLRLWLKPDVLRARSAPHLITLLVGRQVSSGKMLQAAL